MSKLTVILKKYPLGLATVAVAAVIGVLIVKPQLDFAGWDNYSSYLNLKSNLSKTFFSTWREYRGFGTPSDSEVTDLPRLLFFLILNPFVQDNLLDQIYWALSLVLGVVALYVFAYKLYSEVSGKASYREADLFSALAGFFYLFNLNTLGVFYFPIFPYTPRFFSLPLLALAFLLLLEKGGWTKKNILISIFIFFLCLPAYIIGTVFVTVVIGLGIFSLFQGSLKKVMAVFAFFMLINSFWLLPFANYTLNKSSIIRLAPTFIAANEVQLNKPKEFYKLYDQLVLMPNFFETKISGLESRETKHLHPLADKLNSPMVKGVFLLFPLLYIAGCAVILRNYKNYKRFLWIPLVIFLFIFLSMKEFSWLGFIYAFLNKYVPLFGVLFRFGDTKLHPVIAFAGSIGAALAIVEYTKWPQSKKYKLLIPSLVIGLILHIGTFYNYFIGNTVGFFAYNKIPPAYKNIAITINETLGNGRVIHLPYNNIVYWRSYSWGYLGSHFLGYMINKPLLEKTFEPASMENAYINEKIFQLSNNSQGIENPLELQSRSQSLYETLRIAGVQYVVLDETVAVAIPSRGTFFWGRFNIPDARNLIANMASSGYLRRVRTEEVAIGDYLDTYKKEFELTPETVNKIKNEEPSKITLFEVKDNIERIYFSDNAQYVDLKFDNLLESNLIPSKTTLIQNNNNPGYVYPFKRPDLTINWEGQNIEVKLDSEQETSNLNIGTDNSVPSSHLVNVTGKRAGNTVILGLYEQRYPNIRGQEYKTKLGEISVNSPLSASQPEDSNLSTFASDWHILGYNVASPLRVRVENTVLPLPKDLQTSEIPLGSVIVHSKTFQVEVFQYTQYKDIPLEQLKLTDNPNCFGDQWEGYSFGFNTNDNPAELVGKNGSVCIWRDLKDVYRTGYTEIVIDLEGEAKDLDDNNHKTAKPKLKQAITSLPKPLTFSLCIKEAEGETCLNKHNIVKITERQKLVFPTDIQQEELDSPLMLLGLKHIGQQEMNIKLHKLGVNIYRTLGEKQFTLPQNNNQDPIKGIASELSFPKPLSSSSYYHNADIDSYIIPTDACDFRNGYSTHRILDNKWVTYLENCQAQVFKTLQFSSSNFLLWSIKYNLGSGQSPRFVLKDSFYEYADNLISQYQGYPDIKGFKEFQDPEYITTQSIELEKLNNLETLSAYHYIVPSPELRDVAQKDFRVYQYSENEGLLVIENFDVIELPTAWENLYIGSSDANSKFELPAFYTIEKIIPSLWKVEITKHTNDTEYLLIFNEGFDKQWKAYSSLSKVLFGPSEKIEQARCNGFANCFIVPADFEGNIKTLYLFYWPERLYLLGWVITIATVLAGLILGKRVKERHKTFSEHAEIPVKSSKEYPEL